MGRRRAGATIVFDSRWRGTKQRNHYGATLNSLKTFTKGRAWHWALLLIGGVWGVGLNQGCATQPLPPVVHQPSKVKFSEFAAFEMKHVHVAPDFAEAGPNQKAAKRVDAVLFERMPFILPNLTSADQPSSTTDAAKRTLLIEPSIEEVRFIGGAVRWMAGSWAGDSLISMKVCYRDKTTGDLVADPVFKRIGEASGGGIYSLGSGDNMMLSLIVADICAYTRANR